VRCWLIFFWSFFCFFCFFFFWGFWRVWRNTPTSTPPLYHRASMPDKCVFFFLLVPPGPYYLEVRPSETPCTYKIKGRKIFYLSSFSPTCPLTSSPFHSIRGYLPLNFIVLQSSLRSTTPRLRPLSLNFKTSDGLWAEMSLYKDTLFSFFCQLHLCHYFYLFVSLPPRLNISSNNFCHVPKIPP